MTTGAASTAFAALVLALAVALAAVPASADPGAADADGDQVPDVGDRCPRRPGLLPDGCPPSDRDGDRMLDRHDECPDRPGPIANRGCPDTDRDTDGVVDRLDRCPDVFGRADHHGCEAPDRDGDGLADAEDRCPDRPETWNGRRDRDGCPDRGTPLARAAGKRLALTARRMFRNDGSLATAGRRATAVAADWLAARKLNRARIVVRAPSGASYGDGLMTGKARGRAVVDALADATGLPARALEAVVTAPGAATADPAGKGAPDVAADVIIEAP